jgi:hypothetical protein
LIIENGTFSQTTGAIWSMVIMEQFAGFYLLCILKEKCFKGSLNTLFFKQRHKNYAFAFNHPHCGLYTYFSISLMLSIFLFAKNQ